MAFCVVFGRGSVIGQALVEHAGIAGVCFTGSVPVAQHLNRTLAARDGAILPLIAETGGQNCMIVDSTALLEQAVDDILLSAFGSAGQRCSALRVAMVQEEIAEELLEMVTLAMDELQQRQQLPAQANVEVKRTAQAAVRNMHNTMHQMRIRSASANILDKAREINAMNEQKHEARVVAMNKDSDIGKQYRA